MITDITPLGDGVAVERLEEKYEGSIAIPESARAKSPWGKVIALGTGKEGFAFTVKVGDTVLLPPPCQTEGELELLDGRRLLIIAESELLAIDEAAA